MFAIIDTLGDKSGAKTKRKESEDLVETIFKTKNTRTPVMWLAVSAQPVHVTCRGPRQSINMKSFVKPICIHIELGKYFAQNFAQIQDKCGRI